MQPVSDFPHEAECSCGQRIVIASHHRGLVVICIQCAREHGPFELESSASEEVDMSIRAIREREATILSRASGTTILHRTKYIAESTRPWTPREAVAALAVLSEITTRLPLQNDRHREDDADLFHLPNDEYLLVKTLLELMDRLDRAPKVVKEWVHYQEVVEEL